jgi:four helix bundle protein
MQRFTNLKVWQRSHGFVVRVYKETESFPKHESFGVTSQLRRAVMSVPCNIAEGSKRKSNKEYAHLLNVAEGSAAESEYLLLLCRDLGYVTGTKAEQMLAELREIASMLSGLRLRVEGAR